MHLSKGWRIAVAVIIIAALIPTAVFGASKLYELIAKPEGEHGLSIDVEQEIIASYPEYVKMHVDLPEGFAANSPEPGNMKFYSMSAREKFTDGFSLYPMRFYKYKDMKEYIGNVRGYEEREINGHKAYEVKMEQGWDRLYIYYENVNVFLLIYHHAVSDQQLTQFVNGISFTEGSSEDFTYLDEPSDERPDEKINYEYEERYVELPKETKLTFDYTDHENIKYTAEITGINIIDNISESTENAFSQVFSKFEIADQYGNLMPKTITVTKEGNGFDSVDETISSEPKNQKLILTDIRFENLSDEDLELGFPYRMATLNKEDDGSFIRAEIIDKEQKIHANEYCDSEVVYMEPHGTGSSFLRLVIPADSQLNVTAGFRCNYDMIDQAYLYLVDGTGFITDPVLNTDTKASCCFKVTDNDR